MDILQQELNKNQTTVNNSKSKKIVLMLIVICIILLIMSVLGMMYIKSKPEEKKLTLVVNSENTEITSTLLIAENDNIYVSLEEISKIVGFNYTRGGYLEYTEDNTKCYIENKNQIVGLEADTNKIFKTSQNSTTDYQYFKLKNKIITNNNLLYIALEDLNTGLNLVYNYSEKENTITINSFENIIKLYKDKFENANIKVSTNNFKNMQAIAYGMFVITGENGKMGIVDMDLKTLVGNRYDTIEFDEYSQNFIVSDDGKYGIITNKGTTITDLQYKELEIINYNPLLYKVKKDQKYGLLNKDGAITINIEYDGIGNGRSREDNVLIIKNINNSNKDGLVVRKDNKYGVIDLEKGDTIVNFDLDSLYYKQDNNKITYYVQVNNLEETLEEYINYVNTTVVNLSNNE